MTKLEETQTAIEVYKELGENGMTVDYNVMLFDIAKSLAMIADKLCGSEKEVGDKENG